MEKIKDKALPLLKILLVSFVFHTISFGVAYYIDRELDKLIEKTKDKKPKPT